MRRVITAQTVLVALVLAGVSLAAPNPNHTPEHHDENEETTTDAEIATTIPPVTWSEIKNLAEQEEKVANLDPIIVEASSSELPQKLMEKVLQVRMVEATPETLISFTNSPRGEGEKSINIQVITAVPEVSGATSTPAAEKTSTGARRQGTAVYSTTLEPAPLATEPVKLSPKLLELLKKSKPSRGKSGPLAGPTTDALNSGLRSSSNKKNQTQQDEQIFRRRIILPSTSTPTVHVTEKADDDLVAAPSNPRRSRFFASASSMLSGFVPAIGPPRQGRAAQMCPGGRGPCVTEILSAAVQAEEVHTVSTDAPSAAAAVSGRLGTRRKQPTLPRGTTLSPITEPAPTRPAILSRLSARRRLTTTTAKPVTLEVTEAVTEAITAITEAPTTTTTSRKLSFRRFSRETKAPTSTSSFTQPSELTNTTPISITA